MCVSLATFFEALIRRPIITIIEIDSLTGQHIVAAFTRDKNVELKGKFP